LDEGISGKVISGIGGSFRRNPHRFGNDQKLDDAIESYEKAIKFNPVNGIVNYNIANAYHWRLANTYEAFV